MRHHNGTHLGGADNDERRVGNCEQQRWSQAVQDRARRGGGACVAAAEAIISCRAQSSVASLEGEVNGVATERRLPR